MHIHQKIRKVSSLDWHTMSHLLAKQWQSALVIDQIFQYPEFSV